MAAIAASHPVLAQDIGSAPSLDELIPDSAVENPDEWAQRGADGAASEGEVAEPDTDSPISDIPGIPVAWPEDVEIPALEPLEPEDDIRFADLLEDAPRIA